MGASIRSENGDENSGRHLGLGRLFQWPSSPSCRNSLPLLHDEADLVTCGLIVAEVLQGLRGAKGRRAIEKHFCEMEWLTPDEPRTYLEAAELFRGLRARGLTIRSTVDCVIAKLAADHDSLILSKDRDFGVIASSRLARIRLLPVE